MFELKTEEAIAEVTTTARELAMLAELQLAIVGGGLGTAALD